MNACRRKTDEYVSRSYFAAGYKLFFFTDADAETGDVVFALVVKARHFSGFASEQRAARIFTACGDSFYDFARDLRIERTAGDVDAACHPNPILPAALVIVRPVMKTECLCLLYLRLC